MTYVKEKGEEGWWWFGIEKRLPMNQYLYSLVFGEIFQHIRIWM